MHDDSEQDAPARSRNFLEGVLDQPRELVKAFSCLVQTLYTVDECSWGSSSILVDDNASAESAK
jgi:hypothetical protein